MNFNQGMCQEGSGDPDFGVCRRSIDIRNVLLSGKSAMFSLFSELTLLLYLAASCYSLSFALPPFNFTRLTS